MIDTSNNTITTTNVLLYKIVNGTLSFLLAQENDNNWGLPGGAKEIEDVNLLNTIQRELKEELGLEPNDYTLQDSGIKREFEYNHFQSSRFGKHGVVVFFIAKIRNEDKIKMNSELKTITWCTHMEAEKILTFDHIKDGFSEVSSLIK